LASAAIASDVLPIISPVNPVPSASGLAPNIHFTATFSKDIDPITITFKLVEKANRMPVPGSVVYDSLAQGATFRPRNELANSIYRSTITTDAKDKAGNVMAQEDTWEFTVGP
jgi:hypothetical protein